MVRETGLEPACPCEHTDLNRARLPIPPFPQLVDGGGFEPPKSVTADLQSAPFGRSGTHPRKETNMRFSMVGVKGFEPPAPCSQSTCATGLRYTPSPKITTALSDVI